MACGLWVLCIDSVACVCERGRGSILSSAHSLPSSPAEPLYLPHLAHGANGNQPFSGEQKRKRVRTRKIEMHALSLSLMELSEASRRRKLGAGAGVDCRERDRGWEMLDEKTMVENHRAGCRNRSGDKLKWKMRKMRKKRRIKGADWCLTGWPDAGGIIL